MGAPLAAAAIPIALKALAIGLSGFEAARKLVPQLEDEVTVEVVGEPGHDKQQLYFLALSAANGEVRRLNSLGPDKPFNLLATSYGMLMIEFDQASNWVRCTIRYKTSMLAANAGFRSIPLPRTGTFFDNLAVYRGPACEVVGDTFDFVDSTFITPGIPASSISPDAPNGPTGLPFKGQTIVTMCPTTTPPVPKAITQNPVPTAPKVNNGPAISSPNPKPIGDNRSRGAIVVPGTPVSPPSPPPPPTSPSTITTLIGSLTVPGSGTSTVREVTGATGVISGGTSSTGSLVGSCCPKVLALIPLVFAALSAPATNSKMKFVEPTQGPTGG